MNNKELKAKFNEYYWLAVEIMNEHERALEQKDILKITDILVKIDNMVNKE